MSNIPMLIRGQGPFLKNNVDFLGIERDNLQSITFAHSNSLQITFNQPKKLPQVFFHTHTHTHAHKW